MTRLGWRRRPPRRWVLAIVVFVAVSGLAAWSRVSPGYPPAAVDVFAGQAWLGSRRSASSPWSTDPRRR